jgi:hypothetical protein
MYHLEPTPKSYWIEVIIYKLTFFKLGFICWDERDEKRKNPILTVHDSKPSQEFNVYFP